MHLGVFFAENPQNQPGAKVLIVVQAISLKIDTLDISGLLFLNLQLELSYEVWIKSYKHLKSGFLSGRVHIGHILTTRCEAPSWSRSNYSPDYDISEIFIEYKQNIVTQMTNNGFRGH